MALKYCRFPDPQPISIKPDGILHEFSSYKIEQIVDIKKQTLKNWEYISCLPPRTKGSSYSYCISKTSGKDFRSFAKAASGPAIDSICLLQTDGDRLSSDSLLDLTEDEGTARLEPSGVAGLNKFFTLTRFSDINNVWSVFTAHNLWDGAEIK